MGEATGGRDLVRVIAAAFLLCAAASPALAQTPPTLELTVRRDGAVLLVTAAPREGPEAVAQRQAVTDALAEGYRSRLTVQLRLYERTPGLAGLLGDRLVLETVVTREIRHELIADRWVIEETIDGSAPGRHEASSAGDLLEVFFRLSDLALPLETREGRGYYLRARYRLSPIRVTPELALVALFAGPGERESGWSVVGGFGP